MTMNATIKTLSTHRCHGGVQGFYEVESAACAGPMRFGVFLPPGASSTSKAPAVWALAGLECNEQTFAIKAGAQKKAAQLGLAIVTPDTSPRQSRFDGDDASWDFGLAASFYVDAARSPWSRAYKMETFITDELRAVVEGEFDVDGGARGVMGHSMGGHGALTFGLRHADLYKSVSAFAPIVAPSQVPWGQKAFSGYFCDGDVQRWRAHDSVALVAGGARFSDAMPGGPLVDQGLSDKFLDVQLRPWLLRDACASAGQPLTLREHAGYDHGYFFVQSVVDDHLAHHRKALG